MKNAPMLIHHQIADVSVEILLKSKIENCVAFCLKIGILSASVDLIPQDRPGKLPATVPHLQFK